MKCSLAAISLTLLQIHTCVFGATDYCKFQCPNPNDTHTACPTKCRKKSNVELVPQTFAFRKKMLDIHNGLRNAIATGRNTSGGNGPASNMRMLSYDMELESTVTCLLAGVDAARHDSCRGTADFPYAGQNLMHQSYVPVRDGRLHGDRLLVKLVGRYFAEVTHCSGEEIDRFTRTTGDPATQIGHFVQMVWADNAYIGCALSVAWVEGGRTRVLHGCNFGPGGNVLNMPVYRRGEAASACPEGTTPNREYPGLCGEMRAYQPAAHRDGNSIVNGSHGKLTVKMRHGAVLLMMLFVLCSY